MGALLFGRALVEEAHRRARRLGYTAVVLIGIPEYYHQFGYLPLDSFPITVPYAVPEQSCMILPLFESALAGVRGGVEYPAEWME
jgi:predicted N-acetyltransferase YhbS